MADILRSARSLVEEALRPMSPSRETIWHPNVRIHMFQNPGLRQKGPTFDTAPSTLQPYPVSSLILK